MTVPSLQSQVRSWVIAHCGDVTVRNPVSNHIDEILERPIESVEAIGVALAAFLVVVDVVSDLDRFVQPMLNIPLQSVSNHLLLSVPQDFQALTAQWRSHEPPSLYLLDWDLCKYPCRYEEYRRPLPFSLFAPPVPGVDSYYREYRSALDLENDWEYGRSVEARFYPEGYRL